MNSKLKSIRAGHRSTVSRIFKKFDEIRESGTELTDFDELSHILDTLKRKQELLRKLDEDIIQDLDQVDIETEIVDSDEYSFNLETKVRQIAKVIKAQTSTLNANATSFTNSRCDIPPSDHSNSSNLENQNYTHFRSDYRSYSSVNSEYNKLPKLNLPTFDGDILQWQSFWDSFEAAVHTNPTLSNVQRFNYLKSLLHDEAFQTINGFALTNSNYERAVSLLQQRFGQVHKITQKYMNALLELPSPKNTLQSLRNYYDKIETYVRGLESLGQTEDTFGSLLVPIILKKLPGDVRINLTREHGSTSWQLSELRQVIFHELNIMEEGNPAYFTENITATAAFYTNAKVHTNKPVNRQSNVKSCVFCHESHAAVNCTKIIEHKARISIVKRDRLCFNCLGHHNVADCKSYQSCRKCKKRHHTSLCKDEVQRDEKQANANVNVSTIQETQHNAKETGTILHSQAPTNVLLKTAVAQVSSGFQCTDANILFDEGAQRSFITEQLATDLNLAINGNETISLSGFGDTNESRKVRHLNTGTIYLLTDAGKLPINVLIVPEIAAPLTIYVHKTTNLKYLSGLKLAHPVSHDPIFEVSLLIGVDHYWSIVEDKIVRGAGPTAVKSKIGYLLSGPIKGCTVNSDHTCTSMMNVLVRHKDEEINLEKFWEVEAAGVENTVNKSENGKFQDVYEENYISYHGNRYVAKLPWKEEHPTLLDNRNIAQRRTENVMKRLSREPTLLQKYGQIINEQEKRGFIERVDEQSSNTKVHYIAHHPVRKESSTTPIRIVFDCSCKPTHESPSLNDCLMDLSPNLNDLTGILLRFRMHKYAVATDIEKAFLNIGLDEDDRDVTRFFWLSNPDDPNSRLTTYRFRSVLFGATCSPFILNAVLRKHLTENPTDWTTLLKKDLYVDNIISSFNQQGDLLNYFHTSRSVFEKAGFNLRSWASNCKELQNRAAAENVIDDDKLVKILGLRWDTENDILTFAHWESKSVDDGITTKRDILRQSSKVYDPLGIISPITVRSKMLMQHIWEMKVDWDEPLSSDVVSQWRDIQTDTYECTKLEISRCYLNNTLNTDKLHIHIFTDASLKAYGSCAYIVDVDGKQSTLVMAKNKVAPLKKMTIPKLELMASVIGARLLNHLMEHINIEQATLWCDSQIVLNWLKTEKQLPDFVRNRVTEIKQLTSKFKWRYCPTESNPADLLSRGMSADKFKNSQLWMHGPQWITDTSKWPSWISNDQHQILSVSTDDTETVKKDETTKMDDTIGLHRIFNIDQFSSYQKLLRVSAYVLRFIRNCRKDKKSGMLTVSEIQNMSTMLILNSQHRNYAEIVNDLQAKRTKNSLVKQLKLYLDDESIIRCGGGRINNANTLESAKFPVLLWTRKYSDRFTSVLLDSDNQKKC